MSDFHCGREITATRWPHTCEQCGTEIPAGSPAHHGSGSYAGDFYSWHAHPECHAAAVEFADLNDLYGEDSPWFVHGEFDADDQAWLREHHPTVADRLGWCLPEATHG